MSTKAQSGASKNAQNDMTRGNSEFSGFDSAGFDLTSQAASFANASASLAIQAAPAPAPTATQPLFSAINATSVVTPTASTSGTVSSVPSVTAPTTTRSTALPSWITSLSTGSISADMAAADVNGSVTYSGLEKVISDLVSNLTASKTTLTAAEFADLKTITANLNNGAQTSSYLTNIMQSLVNGNAANSAWTGGAATSTALGNLAVGMTATQLSELNGKWFLGTDLSSSTVSVEGTNFSISYSASVNPLFGATGPSMNDVNQGQLGDCYLLSCLAEVAKQDSGLISSMFTSNGNNTYGVRFYVNGVAEYVTVNNSLANGGRIFNSGSDIWASLAEKAYTQLQASGVVTGNSINYGNSYSTIGNGGAPDRALEEITGASQITDIYANGSSWENVIYNSSFQMKSYSVGNSTASVLSMLAHDLSIGDDVVLSSYTNATDSSGKTTLVASHAMSIYGFDSATNMLQVRNPWGTENGQYWDTTFEVSLATLLSDGDTITVDNAGTGAPPPALTAQTAAQTWKLGQAVNFTLAANTFTDSSALTYSASLSSGAALPSWLTFNAKTQTFTGTVANSTTGLNIKVTATDANGLSSSETFAVATPVPVAPTLTSQTTAQTWKHGQAVNFSLASNTFTDPQAEAITYSAALSNGAPLPSWLSFNASTRTFSGLVPNNAAGLSIKVTATDLGGASSSETFSVATPAPAAPIVSAPTASHNLTAGQTFTLTLAANTFTDPQNETLTYSATQANGAALPTWLKFNGVTDTFSGTAATTAQSLSLKVTATDTGGASVSETFTATIVAAAAQMTQAVSALTSGSSSVSAALGQLVSPPSSTLASPAH